MIRQPGLTLVAFVAFVAAIGFAAHRLYFLTIAHETIGRVTDISIYEGLCRGGRRRGSSPCSKCRAEVSFSDMRGVHHTLSAEGGKSYGYRMSNGHVEQANCTRHNLGDTLKVVYESRHPENAYIYSLFEFWGIPFGCFMGGLICFISSFIDPFRRSYW